MHAYIHVLYACIHTFRDTCLQYIHTYYTYNAYNTYNTYTAYIHSCPPAHPHTYIHTYVHTYIPTYIHTYINTYKHAFMQKRIETRMSTYMHTYLRAKMCCAGDLVSDSAACGGFWRATFKNWFCISPGMWEHMFQKLVISITLMLLDFIHGYRLKVCNRIWLTFRVRPEFYPAQSLGTKFLFQWFWGQTMDFSSGGKNKFPGLSLDALPDGDIL